jgi:hypothetical protein
MLGKSFQSSKRGSETTLRSPGPIPSKEQKPLVQSRGPKKDQSARSIQKQGMAGPVMSQVTHTDTQMENTVINCWPVGMDVNAWDSPADSFVDSGAKDQALHRIKLLEEQVAASEKQFGSVWAATQQQKKEEIEGCFTKLAQAVEISRAESLAKLGSYFVSVRKAFQAQKAETEAMISRINFRLRESDASSSGGVNAELASLESKINSQFWQPFREVSGVRVAYKKSVMADIPKFCRIDVADAATTPSFQTSAANPFVEKRLVFEGEGSPEKGSATTSPNLQTSEMLWESNHRNTSATGKEKASGSFLSRNKSGRVVKAHSEQVIDTNVSLSPVPNSYKQAQHKQDGRLEMSLNKSPQTHRVASRPKEGAQQTLLRALTEMPDTLALNGMTLDAGFLRKNAESFCKLRSLRVLNLDSNRFGDDALPILAEILPKLPLQKLSLQYNQVTEASLPLLREIISKRSIAFHVDLTCNDIGLSEEQKAKFEGEMRQWGSQVVL